MIKRCFLALLFLAGGAQADPLPLPDGGDPAPESEDNTDFSGYVNWDLTDWDMEGANSYSAAANPNGGVTATYQSDVQNAVYYGMMAATQATAGHSYQNMVNALIDAGSSHHAGFDNSILVAPGISSYDVDATSFMSGAIHKENLASTSYVPLSKHEIAIAGASGDYSSGAVKDLKVSMKSVFSKTVPNLGVVAPLTASSVTAHSFGTIYPAGMSPWNFTAYFSGGSSPVYIVGLVRSIILIGIGVMFAYQASQIPRKYV